MPGHTSEGPGWMLPSAGIPSKLELIVDLSGTLKYYEIL